MRVVPIGEDLASQTTSAASATPMRLLRRQRLEGGDEAAERKACRTLDFTRQLESVPGIRANGGRKLKRAPWEG